MKAAHVRTLANIASKPSASPSVKLVAARRVCRLFCLELDTITAERRALRRQAAKLRAFLPFTAATVADLEQQADNHMIHSAANLRTALAGFGRVLVLDAEGVAAALGFDAVCDLLNINPAHREQARKDGGESLRGLVFIAGAEDSAEQHAADWNNGPLFRACLLAMREFMSEHPGTLPDPFAPGAPFGPKLPPKLRAVEK